MSLTGHLSCRAIGVRRPGADERLVGLIGIALQDAAIAAAIATCATKASVGMPPSISRAGAGACTTVPTQVRQANFGRLVTMTRSLHWDDIEALRTVLADHYHRRPAARTRGVLRNQRHLNPRQMGRQGATACSPPGCIVLAQLGIALLRSASSLAIACSSASRPSCICSSGIRSDFAPNCIRVSFSSRWRSRSFCACKMSRSVTAASRSAKVAKTNARNASAS